METRTFEYVKDKFGQIARKMFVKSKSLLLSNQSTSSILPNLLEATKIGDDKSAVIPLKQVDSSSQECQRC